MKMLLALYVLQLFHQLTVGIWYKTISLLEPLSLFKPALITIDRVVSVPVTKAQVENPTNRANFA